MTTNLTDAAALGLYESEPDIMAWLGREPPTWRGEYGKKTSLTLEVGAKASWRVVWQDSNGGWHFDCGADHHVALCLIRSAADDKMGNVFIMCRTRAHPKYGEAGRGYVPLRVVNNKVVATVDKVFDTPDHARVAALKWILGKEQTETERG